MVVLPEPASASTLEIWGALLNGGRMVMPPPGALSLAELGSLIERHGVTALWLTAGLFHQMVGEEGLGLAAIDGGGGFGEGFAEGHKAGDRG